MRSYSRAIKSTLASLILVCVASAAQALPCTTVCYVSPTGLDANDGATPGTAKLTIQAAVTQVSPGGTVNVAAGTFVEDVTIPKQLSLLGAGSSLSTISGPIGGSGAGITVASAGVVIAGFTVTREGNNTTDWNNAGLNSVGIAIQGQTNSAEIRNCKLTGNRTGIDINNSNGNWVHDNLIDFNRTGLIFRNQTDSTIFKNNVVTNNWTVGILFLDGSGGTNVPPQQASSSNFNLNNISANWFGQVVDRQSGGALPPAGTNLKDFTVNHWGASPPVVTIANSAEPGYAAQIPVAYGGSATPPGGQPDIAGPASANIVYIPTATVSVTAVSANALEGNSGTANKDFTLTRVGDTLSTLTVTYSLTGTAASPEDYTVVTSGTNVCSTSTTCTFNSGETTKIIRVAVSGDGKNEDDETVIADLTGISGFGGALGSPVTGTYTILNDDAAPSLTFANVTVTEPNVGTVNAVFNVTLSAPSGKTVTVFAQTSDGTAVAPGDYTATGPTLLVFAPGVVSQPFAVPVLADAPDEFLETFTVTLSSPFNATLATVTRTGSINDDPADVPAAFTINDVTVTEGNGGPVNAVFTITLNGRTDKPITIQYETQDNLTAKYADSDFVQVLPTTLIFPVDGLTTRFQQVTVVVNGDTLNEANEQYRIRLFNEVNATIADNLGIGTITNDDTAPSLSIGNVSVTETDGPGVTAVFTVTLSPASGQTVSVSANTLAGTALGSTDYTSPGSQSLVFAPGQTIKTYTVPITGDLLNEATTETFTVNLTGAVNATIGTGTGTATITDNDPLPTLSINSVSANEGDSGNTFFGFVVTLTPASGRTVTVTASTANGTAIAPGDYTAATQAFSFAPGQTTKSFPVAVKGDLTGEPDETFQVNLSAVANANVSVGSGTGTIVNDDPGVTISDAMVTEGGNLVFTVTRTVGTAATTFNYSTSDGTATAPSDYTPPPGNLGMGSIPFGAPGATTTITIPTIADGTAEAHETMTVTLSNVVGFVLDGTGVGTIYNDDGVVAGSLVISEFRASGPGGSQDQFVEIANTTNTAIGLGSTDFSGFSVWAADGTKLFSIPDNTTIPARGHYLATNAGYSLANYGGALAAQGDVAFGADLAPDTGIALYDKTGGPSPAGTVLDSVGFGADSYVEGGTGLNAIGSPTTDTSFVRKHQNVAGGAIVDNNNSFNDWMLVAVDAGSYGPTPTLAILGGPSPENLAAEREFDNAVIPLTGIDQTLSLNAAPNRQGVPPASGDQSGIEFRRRFTNNTGQILTGLRFKVTTLTTLNNQAPGEADLRVATSNPAGPFTVPIGNSNPPSVTSSPLGLTLEDPPTSLTVTSGTLTKEGGLNSTLRLAGPFSLGVGKTLDVNFKVFTHAPGSFTFWLVVEGK